MSRFIETIKIENGRPQNLIYHMRRFNLTRQSVFPMAPALDLEKWINVPRDCREGCYKCRITYGQEIEFIEYELYKILEVKSIKLITDDEIEYSFKYRNRFAIERLFALRERADDIIILKHGRITDGSFSNLIFLRDSTWFTPLYPLLKGTKRQKLIEEGLIIEKDIRKHEISDFEKVSLINAMLDPGKIILDIKNII